MLRRRGVADAPPGRGACGRFVRARAGRDGGGRSGRPLPQRQRGDVRPDRLRPRGADRVSDRANHPSRSCAPRGRTARFPRPRRGGSLHDRESGRSRGRPLAGGRGPRLARARRRRRPPLLRRSDARRQLPQAARARPPAPRRPRPADRVAESPPLRGGTRPSRRPHRPLRQAGGDAGPRRRPLQAGQRRPRARPGRRADHRHRADPAGAAAGVGPDRTPGRRRVRDPAADRESLPGGEGGEQAGRRGAREGGRFFPAAAAAG